MKNSQPRGRAALAGTPSEGGRSKAKHSWGCQQDSSLTIPCPLVTGYLSAAIRNRVQTRIYYGEGDMAKVGMQRGEREKRRLVPRHLLLSETVVLRVVPTGSTSQELVRNASYSALSTPDWEPGTRGKAGHLF